MKQLSILGATGSIGTQTLDLVRRNPEEYQVLVLTGGTNIALLSQQIETFHPKLAVTARESDAALLGRKYPAVQVLHGRTGLLEAASYPEVDLVLNALVGILGLEPTHAAVKTGKTIALANKESLVAGGAWIMSQVQKHGIQLLPVDSEHNAIFQCLEGNRPEEVKRILLTASGGPFRGYTLEQLQQVTLEQSLSHPNWNMGKKITIDSATMMNKGLEVIEASRLFGLPGSKIQVVIHPQSIIHSMVEFQDRAVLAELGEADMRIPISHALAYPKRLRNEFQSLDLTRIGSLTFEEPDLSVFRCLKLAYDALDAGDSYPVVLNAANEVLVDLFLRGRINFLQIQETLERMLSHHQGCKMEDLETILELDRISREEVIQWVS